MTDTMALAERERVLRASAWLATAPAGLLSELAGGASERSYGRGEFVYGRTEVAEDLYFLLDGRIAYPEVIGWVRDEALEVQIADRPGQAFGFAGALLGYARRAVSALCEGPTRVLRLSGAALARACVAHGRPELLERLVRAHLRYARLGPRPGWTRLQEQPWRMLDGALAQAFAPLERGGVCAVLLPRAGGGWAAIASLLDAAALPDPHAPRASAALLRQFGLDPRAPRTDGETLQWQLLAHWSKRRHAAVSLAGPALGAVDRRAFLRLARRAARQLQGTVYVGLDDLDLALSRADRVVLPAPSLERAMIIDLPAVGRTGGAVPRARATDLPVRHAPVLAPPRVPADTELAPNRLWEDLQAKRFFWTVEFIPSHEKVLRTELDRLVQLAGAARAPLAGFSVTDRVHSDFDPDPIATALHIKERCRIQPLVHLSGKGRELAAFSDALCRLDGAGLANVLLLSGDRLKNHAGPERARYLESVCAIQAARRALPNLRIGAALNPFKYREEEGMAQYLKLGKKIRAGADFIITQVGYDMDKSAEALAWMASRGYRVPVVANAMLLNGARARWIRRQRVPGIVISDELLGLVEHEERILPDRGAARARERLAAQIVGLRLLGYGGVQITGLHTGAELAALATEVARLDDALEELGQWRAHWRALHSLGTDPVRAAPGGGGWYWSPRPPAQRGAGVRYRLLEAIHRHGFDRGPVAATLAGALGGVRAGGMGYRALKWLEQGIKGPLFGCESCGMCRLAATQYVCPETCPKGLANGPCGGTAANRCEFGDRECIHSRKYRIARDAGVLDQLETWMIPPVPQWRRGTPSWPAHFSGDGPRIEALALPAASLPRGGPGLGLQEDVLDKPAREGDKQSQERLEDQHAAGRRAG